MAKIPVLSPQVEVVVFLAFFLFVAHVWQVLSFLTEDCGFDLSCACSIHCKSAHILFFFNLRISFTVLVEKGNYS